MKTFTCSCEFHNITVDIRPLKNSQIEFVGLTIYEHRSGKTGRLLKKPRELGTVVLIDKEARKFKDYLNKNE
jgi:hypothetical protein